MTIINDFPFTPLKEPPTNYCWICPKCGAVMSPSMPVYYFCNGQKITSNNTSIELHIEDEKKKI